MSGASTKKVFIQIESAAEQEEHLKIQRKTLKILQGIANTDKENLAGRQQLTDKLSRLKAVATTELNTSNVVDHAKRKKLETKAAETQTSPNRSKNEKTITVEDLTGNGKPSEYYWERLAEKRREALDEALIENQHLHERIEGLEEELNTSRQQLLEAQHLVAVLTDMLEDDNDDDNEAKDSAKNEDEKTEIADDANSDSTSVTPSTSGTLTE